MAVPLEREFFDPMLHGALCTIEVVLAVGLPALQHVLLPGTGGRGCEGPEELQPLTTTG